MLLGAESRIKLLEHKDKNGNAMPPKRNGSEKDKDKK